MTASLQFKPRCCWSLHMCAVCLHPGRSLTPFASTGLHLTGVPTVQDGASWCHKTYCYGPASDVDFPQCVDASPQEDAGCITLRLSRNLFEGSTGCHEWEAGFFLAEFVLSHPFMFKGELALIRAASSVDSQSNILARSSEIMAVCHRQEVC